MNWSTFEHGLPSLLFAYAVTGVPMLVGLKFLVIESKLAFGSLGFWLLTNPESRRLFVASHLEMHVLLAAGGVWNAPQDGPSDNRRTIASRSFT